MKYTGTKKKSEQGPEDIAKQIISILHLQD